MKILTIGHSTLAIDDFINILKNNGIDKVVDIRTIPRSRHNPQFNLVILPVSLKAAKIGYQHMKGLGGLRHPLKNSVNMGWENSSFRGFADYMQTDEFLQNLRELIKIAGKQQTVIMCAEAVPWRCHRSLIADALTIKGIHIEHIIGTARPRPHIITPWTKVQDGIIIYPAVVSAKT